MGKTGSAVKDGVEREDEIHLSGEAQRRTAVLSGAFTGEREALELRDGIQTGEKWTPEVKSGRASRSDRMAKFNQLLGIWEEPGNRVIFSGVRGNYSIGEG